MKLPTTESVRPKRRKVLKLLAGALFLPTTRRTLPILMGSTAIIAPSTAQAYWALALTAINTAISVIGAFTSSDGGLSAMLSAINQKTDIIISQLTDVQRSLVNLNIEIKKLPDTIKTLLTNQYQEELIDRIAGAAQAYSEVRSAADSDPTLLQDENIIDRIKFISEQTNTARTILSKSAGATAPESIFIIPTAMFLEVASLSHLSFPTAYVASVIEAYRTWLERAVSAEPESIVSTRAANILLHQQVVDRLSGSRIGKLHDFVRFSFQEKNEPLTSDIPEVCFMFSPHLQSTTVSSRDAIMQGLAVAANLPGGGTILEQRSVVDMIYSEQIGAFQYEYGTGIVSMNYAFTGKLEGFGLFDDTSECFVRMLPATNDIDAAVSTFDISDIGSASRVERATWVAEIEQLNLLRGRIELCRKAALICFEAIDRANEQLKLLGVDN